MATKEPLGDARRLAAAPATGGAATTACRSRAPTSSPASTRSPRRWSSATRNGRAGAECSSPPTTWRRWAPSRSARSTPLAAARRRARRPGPDADSRRGARRSSCRCSAATRSSACPRALSRHRPRATRRTRCRPAAGARAMPLTLTADLEGGWRPGYRGRQWDSTSWRTAGRAGADARGRSPGPPARRQGRLDGGDRRHRRDARRGLGAAAPSSTSPQIPRPTGAVHRRLADLLPGIRDLTADAADRAPASAGAGAACRPAAAV